MLWKPITDLVPGNLAMHPEVGAGLLIERRTQSANMNICPFPSIGLTDDFGTASPAEQAPCAGFSLICLEVVLTLDDCEALSGNLDGGAKCRTMAFAAVSAVAVDKLTQRACGAVSNSSAET